MDSTHGKRFRVLCTVAVSQSPGIMLFSILHCTATNRSGNSNVYVPILFVQVTVVAAPKAFILLVVKVTATSTATSAPLCSCVCVLVK